jgi:phosphate transport system protein
LCEPRPQRIADSSFRAHDSLTRRASSQSAMDVRHAYHKDLDRLALEILDMGELVKQAMEGAMDCLVRRDASSATRIIEEDRRIDAAELAIEDRAVALLGTEQPVATDLRRLVMALKVVTQLERMGDHAAHVARAARRLAAAREMPIPPGFSQMAKACVSMLSDALEAFAETDPRRAMALSAADEAVDGLHDQTVRGLVARMREDPVAIEVCLELIRVSGFLERIADHATNIGEWVVYGGTARHVALNP